MGAVGENETGAILRWLSGLSKEGLRAFGGEEEGVRTGGSSSIFFTVFTSCVLKVSVAANTLRQPLSLFELWTFCDRE